MPAKIFINYRRDDDPSGAARIRDGLAKRFGQSNVFMDVDNLLVGQKFHIELAKALEACDIFIAVIGPRWLQLLKERQKSGEEDYVRLEIAEALRRNLSVIPVRVGREGQLAPVPRKADLPEDIQELVLFQKHDVAHERSGRDMAELVDAVSAVRRRDGSRFGARGVQLAGIVAGLAVTAGVVYFGTQQSGLKIDLPWQREFGEPVASRIDGSVPSTSERAPAQGSRIASHTQQEKPSAALPPTPTATESISWRMASAFPKSVGGAFDAGEALSRRLAEVTSGQIRVRGYAAGEIVPAAQVLNSVASGTIEAGWTFMGLHGDKEPAFKFMSGNAPLGLDANGLVRWAQSETGARARTSCSRHGASKVCRARSRGRQASG